VAQISKLPVANCEALMLEQLLRTDPRSAVTKINKKQDNTNHSKETTQPAVTRQCPVSCGCCVSHTHQQMDQPTELNVTHSIIITFVPSPLITKYDSIKYSPYTALNYPLNYPLDDTVNVNYQSNRIVPPIPGFKRPSKIEFPRMKGTLDPICYFQHCNSKSEPLNSLNILTLSNLNRFKNFYRNTEN